MFKLVKNFLSFRKFVKFANSVGYNIKNPHPVETIAFQTVAISKLNPKKDSVFNHNSLTKFDTIIFTLFFIRMLCITQISNRTKAEEFSNFYISKVFQYFPDAQRILKQYDALYFAERVKYYDCIVEKATCSDGDHTKLLVDAFTKIITYGYKEEYIRFDENTPSMIIDVFEQFKITNEVNIFFNSLPDFFAKLLPDIFKVYN